MFRQVPVPAQRLARVRPHLPDEEGRARRGVHRTQEVWPQLVGALTWKTLVASLLRNLMELSFITRLNPKS